MPQSLRPPECTQQTQKTICRDSEKNSHSFIIITQFTDKL